ncbi:hypothetical protein BJX64DRAFT_256951 [Aspergillus heterothallicus]
MLITSKSRVRPPLGPLFFANHDPARMTCGSLFLCFCVLVACYVVKIGQLSSKKSTDWIGVTAIALSVLIATIVFLLRGLPTHRLVDSLSRLSNTLVLHRNRFRLCKKASCNKWNTLNSPKYQRGV